VREYETLRPQAGCSVDQQVQVNRSWNPAPGRPIAAELLLNLETAIQQIQRFELAIDFNYGIEKVFRILPHSHGPVLIDRTGA
jgi:hypothetical protein